MSANDAAAAMQKLRLETPSSGETTNLSNEDVAESWEDAAEEDNDGSVTPVRATPASKLPQAPPPTPASPSVRSPPSSGTATPSRTMFNPDGSINETAGAPSASSKASRSGEERRPDKTTAIASRLIAAAIGQRPAPRTKEQREYDAAMKAQERKRRDQAREEEARKKNEKEKALKDVWGD